MRRKIVILLMMAVVNAMAFSCTAKHKGEQTMDKNVRPAAVAGSFYPGSKEEVTEQLKQCFAPFKDNETRDDIRAVIVPHAGWVFSGEVAASAFALINPKHHFERIFLIGPSHQVWLDAISVNTAVTHYQTPLGDIPVDTEVCQTLSKADIVLFHYDAKAHAKEHCLEVQLPFLQYHLEEMPPIVPVIIATDDAGKLSRLNEALKPWFNEKNLFVISSDFSHYPDYEGALLADGRMGEAVASGSAQLFLNMLGRNAKEHIKGLSTSACGAAAIYTLLLYTEHDPQLKVEHVMYRNSGDSEYGDKERVVGYHSFIVSPKEKDPQAFCLSEKEKQTLLGIARQSIADSLNHKPQTIPDVSEHLQTPLGAFVTLHKQGRLRGCIGHFGEDVPLHQIVSQMARAAAFEDPRFPVVTADEMDDIDIEISVLTPLKRILSVEEFQYGRHGIYIRKGYRSGTFLPQVAQEVDWTKEEFLGHCAQDKAGIGWNGWRDAELYTYEAILFEE